MTDLFTPKAFTEITGGMVERLRQSSTVITDFNVGSVVRSILEAGAVELDDYYQEVYFGLLRAIPTAIYAGFGFDVSPAVAAAGIVTVTRQSADAVYTLSAGAVLTSVSGVAYQTAADAVFDVGVEQVDVVVSATIAGAAGNTGPNTLALASEGDLSATNLAVISGGQDQETDEQRAERFAEFIRSLARGTPAALEYGASLPALTNPMTGALSERVQRSAVLETPGHVKLYIHNGSYGASGALVDAVQVAIDGEREGYSWIGGYRPTGMRVDVMVMEDRGVDVALELSGPASSADVEAAVGLYLRAAVYGDTVRPIDIINVVLAVDGVMAATLLEPTAAIVVAPNHVLALGAFQATWTE